MFVASFSLRLLFSLSLSRADGVLCSNRVALSVTLYISYRSERNWSHLILPPDGWKRHRTVCGYESDSSPGVEEI
uniref:Putative secreted peptide n=1 Tax=Anopheles braziliensis TaxID=58242 RepID=A0A2M3ZQQ3_9DIPT